MRQIMRLPVRSDWSSLMVVESSLTRRMSAGTLSPVANLTTSPGTSCTAGSLAHFLSRRQSACWDCSDLSASMAFSALLS